MIGIRTAAVATSFIGAIWCLLSLTFNTDDGHLLRDFGTGLVVALAGALVWFAVYLWEGK